MINREDVEFYHGVLVNKIALQLSKKVWDDLSDATRRKHLTTATNIVHMLLNHPLCLDALRTHIKQQDARHKQDSRYKSTFSTKTFIEMTKGRR